MENEKIETGGPAFPIVSGDDVLASGVTVHDYFAAKALQGLLANPSAYPGNSIDWLTAEAGYFADAMIKARG